MSEVKNSAYTWKPYPFYKLDSFLLPSGRNCTYFCGNF